MATNHISAACFWSLGVFLIVISFGRCSADSEGIMNNEEASLAQSEASFSVILSVYSDNTNITAEGDVDNTTLYVFDANNHFVKQITVDRTYPLQAKRIPISSPGSERITVIAWAGLSAANEEVGSMNSANLISDLQVRLKQSNGVVSNFPDDLFYGQITISAGTSSTTAQELKMERKISSLALVTKGIVKTYDSRAGLYFYKIMETNSAFNHNGELTGTEVAYIVPATVNEWGNLVAGTVSLFPGYDVTIELYKDGNRILSSSTDTGSEKISASKGKQTNVIFDLSRHTCSIAVSDWGTVVQYIAVD